MAPHRSAFGEEEDVRQHGCAGKWDVWQILWPVALCVLFAAWFTLQLPLLGGAAAQATLSAVYVALWLATWVTSLVFTFSWPYDRGLEGPPLPIHVLDAADRKPFDFKSAKYCYHCARHVGFESHHCALCNACIPGLFHHCELFGLCVGERNLREFAAVMAVSTVTMTLQFVCFWAAVSALKNEGLTGLDAVLQRWYGGHGTGARAAFLLFFSLVGLILVAVWVLWVGFATEMGTRFRRVFRRRAHVGAHYPSSVAPTLPRCAFEAAAATAELLALTRCHAPPDIMMSVMAMLAAPRRPVMEHHVSSEPHAETTSVRQYSAQSVEPSDGDTARVSVVTTARGPRPPWDTPLSLPTPHRHPHLTPFLWSDKRGRHTLPPASVWGTQFPCTMAALMPPVAVPADEPREPMGPSDTDSDADTDTP